MHRFWGLLFGVVLLACLVLTAVAPSMGWWLPHATSTYAPDIDRLFYMILIVVTFFYVLTEVLLVYNIVRFGAGGRRSEFTHGNQKLEIIWSIVPAIILVLIGVLQVKTWALIKYPSHLADNIEQGQKYLQLGVEARQWEYRVRYPSPGHVAEWDRDAKSAVADFKGRLPERIDDIWLANDFHVWKGQKVLMYFKTRDVGHSLFFPNLRLKQDALPGRTIPVWFEATEANTKMVETDGKKMWQDGWGTDSSGKEVQNKASIFDVVCTQYCGTRHSLMRGKLFVHPTKEDFMAWLDHAKATTFEKKASASAVSETP